MVLCFFCEVNSADVRHWCGYFSVIVRLICRHGYGSKSVHCGLMGRHLQLRHVARHFFGSAQYVEDRIAIAATHY